MASLESQYRVAVLVGSLRAESLTRKLAKVLITLAPTDLACTIVEIGDMPLYNDDLEANAPQSWTQFREHIKSVDGILFATPEYNRSIPACLKNALDVGSRPYGHNAFGGRVGAVISQSPGAMGGFGANHALRQSLVFLNVAVMQQPEAYVGDTGKLFNADGTLSNKDTEGFLASFMEAYAAWLRLLRPRQFEKRDGLLAGDEQRTSVLT